MLPSRSLPPLECCFGTSPIQAEKLRPDRKVLGSATLATRAVASIGPTALRLIDLRTDLSRLGQRTALHCRRDPLPGKSNAANHPNPFMPGWLDAEHVQ